MKRTLATALTMIVAIPLMTATLMTTPASAGTCGFKYCGGEVTNNWAGYRVPVSNCWPDGAAEWTVYRSYELGCHSNHYNAHAYDAWMYVEQGRRADDYNHYYDVDAVGFEPLCNYGWHVYGERVNARTFYNRDSYTRAWMKIGNLRVIIVDSRSC